MKIYIAGASAEPERVRRWTTEAERAGFEITLDWLSVIERHGAANVGLPYKHRRDCAADDLRAVVRAEILWVLSPEKPSTGAWVELGYALGLSEWSRRIFVSGPSRERCIFSSLADEYATDEEAFGALLSLRRARENWRPL